MSKNLTRKGLALGAVVALGSTLFAGAPAFAIDQITIAPNVGTSTNILQGQTFVLKTDIASSAGTAARLKFKLTNADARGITTRFDSQASAGFVDSSTIKKFDGTTAVSVTSGKATGTEQVITPSETPTINASNLLSIASDYTDGNTAVSVQAFIDENQNNILDTTEYSTAATTVTFYKASNVAATTVITSPVIGDTTLVATTTTVPELNGGMMAANALHVAFTAQGNANAVFAENTTTNGSTMGTNTWVAADKNWVSTAHLAYSLGADRWNGTDAAVADVNLATAIGGGAWYYGNDNLATTAVFTNDDDGTVPAGAIAHSLTAAAGITHYVTYGVTTSTGAAGTAIAEANLLKAVASVDFTTDTSKSITFTTTGLTAENAADKILDGGTLRALVAGTNAAVVAGTYSARAYASTTALGTAASNTSETAVATEGKLETVSNENVSVKSNDSGTASGTPVAVRTKTTSVDFVYTVNSLDTVTNTNTKNPGAGKAVTVSLSALTVNSDESNTTQAGTFKINGKTAPVVLYTDAAGQVKFTLTEATGAETAQVQVTAVAEGQSGSAARLDLNWVDASYTLYDTKVQDGHLSNRTIEVGGSYTFDLALLDQWGVGADGSKYRVQVTAADRTVSSRYETLSATGTASVTLTDGKLGANAWIDVTADIEVKDANGDWGTYSSGSADWDDATLNNASDDEVRIAVIADQNDSIVLDADAAHLYDYKSGSVVADLVDYIAEKAVVAQNRFTSQTAQLGYTNFVTLNGKVQNSVTGLARGGSFVTIAGPSNVLFSVGKVDAFGSITTVADENGFFTVNLASNVAQKDTVITFTTPDGASKTEKVTFSPAKPDTATTVDFAGTPASAVPGSTFNVLGTLKDAFGNSVDTKQDLDANSTQGADNTSEAAKLTVTYVGPGIVFGNLPVETDSKGQFRFAVLTGALDKGTAEITVDYDSNGDGDTTDKDEFSKTQTVVIGAAAAPAATAAASGSTAKIYASATNAAGKTVVVKVNGKTVKSFAGTAAKKTVVVAATAGAKNVSVFVGGVKILGKVVTVK